MAEPLLVVEDLKVHYPIGKTLFREGVPLRALDGVSFTVAKGEVTGNSVSQPVKAAGICGLCGLFAQPCGQNGI